MKKQPKSFIATRWSLISHANGSDQPRARQALEELCQAYWYPVYAAIRRAGNPHVEAEDLTQSFFLHALGKDTFQKAKETRGRFRTFILSCLGNFLHNEHEKATALKRGGGNVVSFEGLDAEERYAVVPRDESTPDLLKKRKNNFKKAFFRLEESIFFA